jgi:serine/threonine-protein kinase
MMRNDTSASNTIERGSRALIGTTLNQRFTLEKELGRGGMGAVYRATDQVLQRSVAIKLLKEQGGDQLAKRIRLEAQILARLLHDHIVRIYDFGEANGDYFLVMEEVEGPSFAKRWRRLPLVDRLRVVSQVADALDYAHHQGVIHRDIKPGNVLLTAADQAKLSDFGLSKLAEQVEEPGAVRGTPHYMSPEQAKGRPLDYRTDLYSLGVMLYECTTGGIPFTGPSMSIMAQQINAAPEPPRKKNAGISESLEALIVMLLAKRPELRPSSGGLVAQALRDEIERVRAGEPGDQAGVAVAVLSPPQTPTVSIGPVAAGSVDGRAVVTSPLTLARPAVAPSGAAPLARSLLDEILANPVVLSPEERYLAGHYLAYLLGGSRRRGLFLRRPLDPRNADRARLILAMTSAMLADGSDEAVGRAVELVERRPDVRASLNPVVVAKYLASRETPSKRKRFRQVRRLIQDASPYAQKHLTDASGALNPGLMPQTLADLHKVAPERTEVDDELVSRWNRVAEVWRDSPDFRHAVLRYATSGAHRDPAAAELWPEVVYPLIERARWQRQFRPKHEVLWDYLCAKVLHVPDAGVRLDRAIQRSVPLQVVEELDVSAVAFVEDPQLDDEPVAATRDQDEDRLTARIDGGVRLDELASERSPLRKDLVPLTSPDPCRFTQGELRDLWQEAVAALRKPGPKTGHHVVPVGPYRLAVIPSVRGRSAGQVAIQGMPNKQIEMLTPSLRLGGAAGKPVIAVWVYVDNSLAVMYLDFQSTERYILWHAPNAQQFNYGDPAELNHMLYHLGMEVPDQLDRALSKRFRPRNPV